MKRILTLLIVFFIAADAYSQGCVAIRSTGGMCTLTGHPYSTEMVDGSWVFNMNTRYFMSNKHYNGDVYQKERIENKTEVINHQFAFDLALTRVFNNRWSAMIDIPIISNARSSLYEHGRTERHSMHSFGLGDVRLAVYRWLINPEKSHNFNVQLGLGFKLPTGDYKYTDFWQNVGPGGTPELRSVDQSIQLGDGGTGITAELNTYFNPVRNLGLYGNVYYLSNPREQNGVRTFRELVSAALVDEYYMSVPDQYMARVGANYAVSNKIIASAGARIEGIPVYDVIGKSGAFRRPGYVVSVEPGLNYQANKVNLYVTVPTALYRNRTQSVTDKIRSARSGVFARGDAAFADYSINFGISFRL
ncbi:MAG: transporter [Pedobacter sp.]